LLFLFFQNSLFPRFDPPTLSPAILTLLLLLLLIGEHILTSIPSADGRDLQERLVQHRCMISSQPLYKGLQTLLLLLLLLLLVGKSDSGAEDDVGLSVSSTGILLSVVVIADPPH
jgi:hypothetical protein